MHTMLVWKIVANFWVGLKFNRMNLFMYYFQMGGGVEKTAYNFSFINFVAIKIADF